ncbi:MAG TPA: hypothetical protein VNV65_10360 [Candidatus Solibacter sp.]|nr:hypothetical protein [Candidatus Solibacter sp.]
MIIEVPIGFPRYNIENGRTHRAQTQYVDVHGLPDDFFTDPEEESVQRAQEQLLLGMIAEQGLDKDLKDKHQKSPLVLTHDGFVIDGNRRLAALRKDGHTENVKAVVLPEDAAKSELFETELELQMARETKAPYNWIDEALHIRHGVDDLLVVNNRKEKDAFAAVARRMNLKAVEVSDILARLAMVDLYLGWLGERGKYHLVPEGEGGGSMRQAFADIVGRMSAPAVKRLPLNEQIVMRQAAFAVILAKGGYQNVRSVIENLRKQPDEVVRRLVETMPDSAKPGAAKQVLYPSPEELSASAPEVADGGDVFAKLATAEPPEKPSARLNIASLVQEPTAAKQVGEALIELVTDLDLEKRQNQRREDPVKVLQRASGALKGLRIQDKTTNLSQVAEGLDAVRTEVERLALELGRMVSSDE